MNTRDQLLNRLNEIGNSLSKRPDVLALLALGSVGIELDRIDEFSDLDFFVICCKGFKQKYIENLDWLSDICPISFKFKNTGDGYKLLFEDGVFCEFAIFEQDELKDISFSEGRLVWHAEQFDPSVCDPAKLSSYRSFDIDYLIGEALTNLYVGLCRYNRGEKLSAFEFIQYYAKDRVLELISTLEKPQDVKQDKFSISRRFEYRYPNLSTVLSKILVGYDHIPESALAILDFLDSNFTINEAIKKELLALCEESKQ